MDREPLHNKIVREIIGRVSSGAFPAGHRLPAERALCKEFDVSRGTLRKGLGELEQLGVVEIKPNSGVYVREISDASIPQSFLPPDFEQVTIDDVIEARRAIETTAVEAACRKMTPAQCKRLERLIDRMADSIDDLAGFLETDLAFHQGLVESSGNVVLVTAFCAIYEYHRFSSVYSSQEEGDQDVALDFHRKILAAMQTKDAAASRRILSEHLDTMKKYSGGSVRSAAPTRKRTPRRAKFTPPSNQVKERR